MTGWKPSAFLRDPAGTARQIGLAMVPRKGAARRQIPAEVIGAVATCLAGPTARPRDRAYPAHAAPADRRARILTRGSPLATARG
jgi:hypothetical protein